MPSCHLHNKVNNLKQTGVKYYQQVICLLVLTQLYDTAGHVTNTQHP